MRSCKQGIILVLTAFALPSCAGEHSPSTAPVRDRAAPLMRAPATQPAEGRDFFPLEIGNRWAYEENDTFGIVATNGDTIGAGSVHQIRTVEATGTTVVGDRPYTVLRETIVIPEVPGVIQSYDVLFRQDPTGLYVAGYSNFAPSDFRSLPLARIRRSVESGRLDPARRAICERALTALERMGAAAARIPDGGASDGSESRLLAYPLHPGASWDVLTEVHFVDTVEGPESLRLPAGRFFSWRINEDTEFFGPPSDQVKLWYGPAGFLQLQTHLQGIFTDDLGNVIGVAYVNENRRLTNLDLAGRNPALESAAVQ